MNQQRQDCVSPAWGSGLKRRLRVVLLGSGDKPHIRDEAASLGEAIAQHADVVLTDLDWKADLAKIDADLAVVLGGDGSILRSANQMGLSQIPVLGVNLGKLGFLAALSPDEFRRWLPEVCAGNCSIVNHLMFHCCVYRSDRLTAQCLGLNETAILGGEPFSLISVDLYVDGELATSYSCDGLIVSTPVGSTAHNLSAGGPILRKSLQAFVISPISPHTLTVRPVVDTADRVYELVVTEPNEGTTLVVDGRVVGRMTADDRVRIERAAAQFQLVEVPGQTYYRTLRTKLGWGGRIGGV